MPGHGTERAGAEVKSFGRAHHGGYRPDRPARRRRRRRRSQPVRGAARETAPGGFGWVRCPLLSLSLSLSALCLISCERRDRVQIYHSLRSGARAQLWAAVCAGVEGGKGVFNRSGEHQGSTASAPALCTAKNISTYSLSVRVSQKQLINENETCWSRTGEKRGD